MKSGAENRKKTIMAGGFGAVALCCLIYMYNALFGGAPNPAATQIATAKPVAAPVVVAPKSSGSSSSQAAQGGVGLGAAPGIAAKKMASTSSSLDPTLDETAMLRTESLVYSGTGRNIFSLVYVPPPPPIPVNVPSARPGPVVPPPPPPPPPTCPPSCPPIALKFFGTAVRTTGVRQAFLLQGEDVYLATQGDIVARKYKIVSISANSIQWKT